MVQWNLWGKVSLEGITKPTKRDSSAIPQDWEFLSSRPRFKRFLQKPSPYQPYKGAETCRPQLRGPFHAKKSDEQRSHSVHQPQVAELPRVLGEHLLEAEGGEASLRAAGDVARRSGRQQLCVGF